MEISDHKINSFLHLQGKNEENHERATRISRLEPKFVTETQICNDNRELAMELSRDGEN
jgi:hypothetical protein